MTQINLASENPDKLDQLRAIVNRVARRGTTIPVKGMADLNINDVKHSTTHNIIEAAYTKADSLCARCTETGYYAAESWMLVIPALANQPGRNVKRWLTSTGPYARERELLKLMRPITNMDERAAYIFSAVSYLNPQTGENGSFRGVLGGYILKSPDHGSLADAGLRAKDPFFARVFLPMFGGHPENRSLHRMTEEMLQRGPRAQAFEAFAEKVCA